MPQFAPQLGTRMGLTAQFVANGREPRTPGAARDPAADDAPDEDDDAEDDDAEDDNAEDDDAEDDGDDAREDAEAVTPEAGLRSRGAVAAGRLEAERVEVACGADVAGAEAVEDPPAGAAAAHACAGPRAAGEVPGEAWAAASRRTTIDEDIAPIITSARSPLSRIRAPSSRPRRTCACTERRARPCADPAGFVSAARRARRLTDGTAPPVSSPVSSQPMAASLGTARSPRGHERVKQDPKGDGRD